MYNEETYAVRRLRDIPHEFESKEIGYGSKCSLCLLLSHQHCVDGTHAPNDCPGDHSK